jgi:hypothetical protein
MKTSSPAPFLEHIHKPVLGLGKSPLFPRSRTFRLASIKFMNFSVISESCLAAKRATTKKLRFEALVSIGILPKAQGLRLIRVYVLALKALKA